MRPDECQVFVGLPGSGEEFTASLVDPDRFAATQMREVIGGHPARWPSRAAEVWSQLVTPRRGDFWLLADTLAHVARAGVAVHTGVTLSEFAAAPKARVVTLVSHCSGQRVEFRDGMHSTAATAEAFDAAYDGTIDLTLCEPVLHDAIRARCGKGPRILTSRSVTFLGLRIAVYRLAVDALSRPPLSFVEAYAEAWARLREVAR